MLNELKQRESEGRPIQVGLIGLGAMGLGIAHQIGLGALVDGYAACRTQFLPFCF
jgi:predicted homoserine dehydrogenase-like protein